MNLAHALIRHGLSALALAVPVSAASAQTVTQLAPLPTRWGISSACFLDSQKGFACGGMKMLSRTLDGGSTWTPISLPGFQSDQLYNVQFFDASVGIVCGNPGGYRTTNGGATWTQVPTFLQGSWYFQDFVSATAGFAGCNGAILRTTDAGATWELRSGVPNCPSMTGMDFLDANVGFASGGLPSHEVGVFKTNNAGLSWTLKLPVASDDVIYLSPGVLLAATVDGVWRSDDAGNTWAPTGAVVPTGMVDLEKVDASTGVGVSGKGDIWRTSDAGFTWDRMWVGEGDLPSDWAVKFSTPLLGTVVGGPSLIYATHDGGLTWTRATRGASFNAYGLAAPSNDTVITVGHHGYVQRMSVGGTWDLFELDPPAFGRDTSYSAVSTADSGFVYVVGHEGSLARSIDGGRTWETLNGAVGGLYANDVKFTDSQNGWLTGWDFGTTDLHETYRTSDGGSTWQVVPAGNFPGVAIEVVGSMVWIQSGAQTQWRSSDGGETFVTTVLPSNSGSAINVLDMSFADASVGYVSGFDGYLARTLDAGSTWTQVGNVSINTYNSGVLAHRDELWVCGARAGGGNAFIKRSMNRGQSWQTWSIGGQFSAPSRMVRTSSRLYISGDRGEIWVLPLPCAADFDADGTLDFFDYDAFVNCFEGLVCPPGKTADFDADGTVDFFDYDDFVAAFEAGC
ncbi:MAG: YCF48-related protein [Planctomycetota bacterium]